MVVSPARTRRVAVLLATSALLAVAACSSPPADPGDSSKSVPAICRTAGNYVVEGEPQRALDLITELREGSEAFSTADPPVSADWCEPQRRAAIAAKAAAAARESADQSTATSLTLAWERFVTYWYEPLMPPLWVMLGLLAAFLVVSRLLLELRWLPLLRVGKWPIAVRALGWVLAVLLMIAASVSATIGLAMSSVLVVVGAGVAGLAGAFLYAVLLAGRLRIAIEVRDDKNEVDAAATTELAAFVYELASAAPAGLEIPSGSDVTALNDTTLSSPIGNAVLSTLRGVLQSLLGVNPWRVSVSSPSANRLDIAVRRNRRAITVASIDALSLGLVAPAPPVPAQTVAAPAGDDGPADPEPSGTDPLIASDLRRVAASAVVIALADQYRGFEGLYEMTSWRSLGLHAVATSGTRPVAQRIRLLSAAVQEDPRNLLAEVALRNHVSRHQTAIGLSDYYEWLVSVSDRLGVLSTTNATAYIDLRRRVLLTAVATGLNLRALSKTGLEAPNLLGRSRELMALLRDDKPSVGALREQIRLRAALQFDAAGGVLEGDAVDWEADALNSPSPSTAFDAACLLAVKGDLAGVQRRLPFAFVNPDYREAARSDPVLGEFRRRAWFKAAIARAEAND